VLQCVAVCCSVLQCVAVCCSVLQCVAVCCSLFKVGLGISRTNADSQWIPVYNAFHQKICCGNETIRRYFCKRDLDAAKRSSTAAESKRRALGNDFSERIRNMFQISKCRGD